MIFYKDINRWGNCFSGTRTLTKKARHRNARRCWSYPLK